MKLFKTLVFIQHMVQCFDQNHKFLNNIDVLAQTADNYNTKDEEINKEADNDIDDFDACNYETERNHTLYHLNDINNADGGSGTQ